MNINSIPPLKYFSSSIIPFQKFYYSKGLYVLDRDELTLFNVIVGSILIRFSSVERQFYLDSLFYYFMTVNPFPIV